jgi:hypothetical protein
MDTLGAWNSILFSAANALFVEQAPETHQFAGVSVERTACRLPLADEAGGMTFSPPVPVVTVSAPCWMPVALFGALPAVAVVRSLARSATVRRRLKYHLCPTCGYDLRASPGRCPECGADDLTTPAAHKSGAATKGDCYNSADL